MAVGLSMASWKNVAERERRSGRPSLMVSPGKDVSSVVAEDEEEIEAESSSPSSNWSASMVYFRSCEGSWRSAVTNPSVVPSSAWAAMGNEAPSVFY